MTPLTPYLTVYHPFGVLPARFFPFLMFISDLLPSLHADWQLPKVVQVNYANTSSPPKSFNKALSQTNFVPMSDIAVMLHLLSNANCFSLVTDLSKNKLSELPNEITRFTALEKLNLYHNVIRFIPETVMYLQCLTYLDIR